MTSTESSNPLAALTAARKSAKTVSVCFGGFCCVREWGHAGRAVGPGVGSVDGECRRTSAAGSGGHVPGRGGRRRRGRSAGGYSGGRGALLPAPAPGAPSAAAGRAAGQAYRLRSLRSRMVSLTSLSILLPTLQSSHILMCRRYP